MLHMKKTRLEMQFPFYIICDIYHVMPRWLCHVPNCKG